MHDLLKHHFPDEAFPQRKKRLASYKRRFDLLPKLVVNSAGNSEGSSFRAAKRQAAKPLGTGPTPEKAFAAWLRLNQTADPAVFAERLATSIVMMRTMFALGKLDQETLVFFEEAAEEHFGFVDHLRGLLGV